MPTVYLVFEDEKSEGSDEKPVKQKKSHKSTRIILLLQISFEINLKNQNFFQSKIGPKSGTKIKTEMRPKKSCALREKKSTKKTVAQQHQYLVGIYLFPLFWKRKVNRSNEVKNNVRKSQNGQRNFAISIFPVHDFCQDKKSGKFLSNDRRAVGFNRSQLRLREPFDLFWSFGPQKRDKQEEPWNLKRLTSP